MTQKKLYYGWIIVAALFCLQGGIMGIITNCRGMFYAPVCEDLGFKLGDFTAYTTFYGVAVVLAIPVAAKLIPRCNLPAVLCTSAAVLAASEYAQAYFSSLWQWYLAAALQGALQAVLFSIVMGLLVNNWFEKKRGLVFGIIGTASGIFGAVMNIVGDRVIQNFGWRSGYKMLGLLLFVLMVPSALLLRRSPAEKGLMPYGHVASADGSMELPCRKGVRASAARRSVALWAMLTAVLCICGVTCYNQLMKNYALSIGYSSAIAASFISTAMVGNMVLKLVLGTINDRFGFKWAFGVGNALTYLAFLLLPVGNTALLYVAAFCMGAPLAMSMVLTPVWTVLTFGDLDYVKIYSYAMIVSGLSSACFYTIFGGVITAGGYGPSIALGLFMCFATTVAAVVAVKSSKKLSFETEDLSRD